MMKKASRFLSLVLCAALLFGMLPGVKAFATEEETETVVQETETAETEATKETTEESTEVTEETKVTEGLEGTEATEATEGTEATEATEATEGTEGTEATEATEATEDVTEATEETEATDATKATEETMEILEEDEGIMLTAVEIGDTFESFEELKVLAGESYREYTVVTYAGSGSLEITEDLTIPANLRVEAKENEVIVASGVTLGISANGYLNCRSLTINGTASVAGGFSVTGALTVNGKLRFTGWGNASMAYPSTVTGEENISSSGSQPYMHWSYLVNSQEELDQSLAAISETSNSYSTYDVHIEANVNLGNVTFPQNVGAEIGSGYTATVPQGATLTVSKNFSVCGTLKVVGQVVVNPNAYFNVINGDFSFGSYTGRLELSESGALRIQGNFFVQTPLTTQKEDLTKFLIGLDSSKYQISQEWVNEESISWSVQSIEGLTKLGTPTELKWGYQSPDKPKAGFMLWKNTEPNQGRTRVSIYREGEAAPVYTTEIMGSAEYRPEYESFHAFASGDFDSGTYYFTVTALGDGTNYYNSDTATSETWEYIRPDKQVGGCKNLFWSWPAANWTLPEDSDGFDLEYYFASTEKGEPFWIGGTTGYANGTSEDIFEEYVQQWGDGYYYFRVRALSPDITQYRNGEWSAMSPAYNLKQDVEDVKDNLDEIVNDSSMTTEEKVSAVQDMDTQKLKDAMLADQSGTGTIAKLEELESKVGTTAVEVTNQVSGDFDQSKVSIVGASLNEVVDKTQDVKLVVDKPAKDNVIPAQYDNSVAVKFSMGLDNIQDEENLKVPVKITLPVPGTINPNFLVVLHYHPDGTFEEVRPYIYQEGSQFYASFVLDRFSDFVMTEVKRGLLGDANSDGVVMPKDAALILQYYLGTVSDSEVSLDVMDVDRDGRILPKDAALALQIYLGN